MARISSISKILMDKEEGILSVIVSFRQGSPVEKV